MDLGLQNKTAVVFAASRGLGKASALKLAEEGCNLAICSRNAQSIEKTAQEVREKTGVRVLAVSVDVQKEVDIQAFAQRVEAEFGSIDILVNNSGGPKPGTFEELKVEDFAQATELLLLNVVRSTKAFLPLLRKHGRGGRILTITSSSVREVIGNLMLSNAVRAAVTGWSKSLAKELAPENILVNCVAPGTIHTERIDELFQSIVQKSDKSFEEVKEAKLATMPMKRFGKPEEFGAAVAFLASQQASYISGITLYVDGAAMNTVV